MNCGGVGGFNIDSTGLFKQPGAVHEPGSFSHESRVRKDLLGPFRQLPGSISRTDSLTSWL